MAFQAFVPIPSGVHQTIDALQFANPKQFENYSMNWLVRRVMDASWPYCELAEQHAVVYLNHFVIRGIASQWQDISLS